MIDLIKLKKLYQNSSKFTWRAHLKEVRGPWCRWFAITEVEPEYKKHVAYSGDDIAYCAAAMNAVPQLIERIEQLEKILEGSENEYR